MAERVPSSIKRGLGLWEGASAALAGLSPRGCRGRGLGVDAQHRGVRCGEARPRGPARWLCGGRSRPPSAGLGRPEPGPRAGRAPLVLPWLRRPPGLAWLFLDFKKWKLGTRVRILNGRHDCWAGARSPPRGLRPPLCCRPHDPLDRLLFVRRRGPATPTPRLARQPARPPFGAAPSRTSWAVETESEQPRSVSLTRGRFV